MTSVDWGSKWLIFNLIYFYLFSCCCFVALFFYIHKRIVVFSININYLYENVRIPIHYVLLVAKRMSTNKWTINMWVTTVNWWQQFIFFTRIIIILFFNNLIYYSVSSVSIKLIVFGLFAAVSAIHLSYIYIFIYLILFYVSFSCATFDNIISANYFLILYFALNIIILTRQHWGQMHPRHTSNLLLRFMYSLIVVAAIVNLM